MLRNLLLAAWGTAIVGSPATAGGAWQCGAGFVANTAEVEKFVAEKRAAGPAGLAEAVELYDIMTASANEVLASGDDATSEPAAMSPEDMCERLAEVVDRVAAQRGATASRLFWHTDLDAAKAAAAASGKPILSLRMLGKLTDEYSCANSRFYRTALYANAEVSAALRENFVLHWQSVRPVPRVTIDFGDGRTLERTLTGNSAHYMLDAGGRPLDVLPGLYSPQEFSLWLQRTSELAASCAAADEREREAVLRSYHQYRRQVVMRQLFADLEAAAPEYLKHQRVRAGVEFFDRQPYEEVWRRIAEHRRGEVKLDESSTAVIRAEQPNAFRAGAVAVTKSIVEDPMLRLVRSFENSLALDTVRNELQLHRKIHDWYSAGEAPPDVDALNERVYAELFLMPLSDPWLGLAPAEAYTALERGGLTAGSAPGSQLGATQ